MAVAAHVSGCSAERRFWMHLPATLGAVQQLKAGEGEGGRHGGLQGHGEVASQAPSAAGVSVKARNITTSTEAAPASPFSSPSLSESHCADKPILLWDETLTLAEAQERTVWHEALSCSATQGKEEVQERRMIEYVVLGDFQTAVAFLLASSPERSARYYRDALVTAVLAAAANPRPTASGNARQMGAPLQVQAAKVLAAHAASMGDPLLAVPLHCAAGLYSEAVTALQDTGHWRYAANLTAHALSGKERAQALQRWAMHVLVSEGSVWRAAGILTAAGCCQEAAQVLLLGGLPDCAAAYANACQAMGLTEDVDLLTDATADARTSDSLPVDSLAPRIRGSDGGSNATRSEGGRGQRSEECDEMSVAEADLLLDATFDSHGAAGTKATLLYSILGAGTSSTTAAAAMDAANNGGWSTNAHASPACDVYHIQQQFHQYLADVIHHI
ncbi:hypothetical protein V8C86DRAFT_2537145 [Haematococcus lacustris]